MILLCGIHTAGAAKAQSCAQVVTAGVLSQHLVSFAGRVKFRQGCSQAAPLPNPVKHPHFYFVFSISLELLPHKSPKDCG